MEQHCDDGFLDNMEVEMHWLISQGQAVLLFWAVAPIFFY